MTDERKIARFYRIVFIMMDERKIERHEPIYLLWHFDKTSQIVTTGFYFKIKITAQLLEAVIYALKIIKHPFS